MIMKKLMLLVLLGMLCIMLGCSTVEESSGEGEADKLVVLADPSFAFIAEDLARLYTHEYGDYAIEVKVLSDTQEIRELQTNSIKTEIMAGRGPDVFLLNCWSAINPYEPLFSDVVEIAMNGNFLPLDEYLADSNYFSRENQPEIILNSGIIGERLMVLPISYSYNLFVVDSSKVEPPVVKNGTFEELFSLHKSKIIDELSVKDFYWRRNHLCDLFDYEDMNLVIDESDLLDEVEISKVCSKAYDYEKYDLAGYDIDTSVFENTGGIVNKSSIEQLASNSDYVGVYIPNVRGGISAYICAYAAISANSKVPAAAYQYIDLLYSEQALHLAEYGEGTRFSMSLDFAVGDKYGLLLDRSYFDRPKYKDKCVDILEEHDSLINYVYYPTEADLFINDELHLASSDLAMGKNVVVDEWSQRVLSTLKMMLIE